MAWKEQLLYILKISWTVVTLFGAVLCYTQDTFFLVKDREKNVLYE